MSAQAMDTKIAQSRAAVDATLLQNTYIIGNGSVETLNSIEGFAVFKIDW